MRTCLSFLTIALLPSLAFASDPPSLAEKLCDRYRQIESLSCEIRKTSAGSGNTVRMLSRIHYRKGGFIHVDSLVRSDRTAATKRRIVADGKKLYFYQERDLKGFSRPIKDLEEPMLSTFRNVPATPVEVLMKLKGVPETDLEARNGFPLRRQYQVKNVTVVLSCNKDERPLCIEFFASPKKESLQARYDYSEFQVTNGIPIPLIHKTTVFLPAGKQTQTRRISNLQINKPVPEHLFNAALFFKGIEFSDDFKQTYSE